MPIPAYSPLVIDHFDHPRHVGQFAPAADVVEGEAGRPEHGAAFHLSARVDGQVLSALRFQAYGCPHCIASASWLCEHLTGRTLADLAQWDWREVAEALQVPAEKRGRMLILQDAVRRLTEAWGDRA